MPGTASCVSTHLPPIRAVRANLSPITESGIVDCGATIKMYCHGIRDKLLKLRMTLLVQLTRVSLITVTVSILGWQAGEMVANMVAGTEMAAPLEGSSDESGRQDSAAESGSAITASWVQVPLFGAVKASANNKGASTSAKQSKYVLRGVFQAPGSIALALIEIDGATGVYRLNGTLETGDRLVEISPDQVILEKADGREAIFFANALGDGAAVAQAEPSTPEPSAIVMAVSGGIQEPMPAPKQEPQRTASKRKFGASAADLAAAEHTEKPVTHERREPVALDTLKDAIVEGDALGSVRFERARAHDADVGLRIRWLRGTPISTAIGLQRGDVIVAVNKQKVTDRDAMQSLIQSLAQTNEIVVELERDEAPYRIVVPLVGS